MLSVTPAQCATALNSDAVQALIHREVDVIQVKNFYPSDLSNMLADKMLNARLYGAYENAPLIGRIGQAYFESQVSAETSARYWDNARAWIREMRAACHPYLTPIDKLRLELDEVWSAGATVASMDGRKMFAGLGRVFQAGGHAEPHQDILLWDAPSSADAAALKSQLAANTYLRLAESGGGLTLWRTELTKDEYEALRNPDSYGIDPAKLPMPLTTIQPEVGELIVFDSRRLHAVEPSKGGHRVTWSNFIGFEDHNKPLKVWS